MHRPFVLGGRPWSRWPNCSPTRPILMGSGTTAENIADFPRDAYGAIVGSSLKIEGVAEDPVDVTRVKRFMAAKFTRGE